MSGLGVVQGLLRHLLVPGDGFLPGTVSMLGVVETTSEHHCLEEDRPVFWWAVVVVETQEDR